MLNRIRGKELFFTYSFPNLEMRAGFTLVELIVVVALIVVLASLAIPVSLRARMQSNEAATTGNLRTISSASESYRGTQNPPSYAPTLAAMAQTAPPYLDSAWITGNQRQGYVYNYSVSGDGETFSTVAAPRSQNVSGINSYCVDHTGVIRRYSSGGGSVGGQTGCNPSGTPI